MLVSKDEIITSINRKLYGIIPNRNKCVAVYDYVKEQYNMPLDVSSDFVTMRKSLHEASEFELFCLFDALYKIDNKEAKFSDYYTDLEISTYKNSKIKIEKVEFPIRFSVTQINDDQWIGRITVKELMLLRKGKLIDYNRETQRAMQRVIRNDKSFYKITVNKASVNAIADLMKRGLYISTPFTFNIPTDEDAKFYYDENRKELVVTSIDAFDINDGYHRYLAACQLSDLDKEFDYVMECRIVNFPVDKAKQFIWQQDQKTRMNKVDSDAMNVQSAANKVVTRVNESSQCYLSGEITSAGGKIDYAVMCSIIKHLYFKASNKIKRSEENTYINTIRNRIIKGFNALIDHDDRFSSVYDLKTLATVLYLMYNYDDDTIIANIDDIMAKIEATEDASFTGRFISGRLFTIIEKLVKEVI